MSPPLRIAVAGFDHLHAPHYAEAIDHSPLCRLVAIADAGVNVEVAAETAQALGCPFYPDLAAMLDRESLDAVYVGTVPGYHLAVVQAASERGIHILCDKPLAPSLDGADAIIETVEQASVKLMVPFNPRFQQPIKRAKQLLDEGSAGELVAISAVKLGRLPTSAPGPMSAAWFLNPEIAGGGGFLDIGIHAADALCWLAESDPRRVYARIGALLHQLPGDDIGVMTVEFDNGVISTLTAGWGNPDATPAWLDVRLEILTTTDVFLIDRPYHDYEVVTDSAYERPPWYRRDVASIVDEFSTAVIEDRVPAITGRDARRAQAVIDAAYRSARSGEPVMFP